ncbi:MAG: uracil-DNA glycosylase [Candidatus Gastranaerophilales bacterium]|nr:uracil-DNA glycosylase [Candidatus Gastranaerophilales bacterium]
MEKSELLDKLKQECLNCNKCELGKTRINLVFSDGNPDSAKYILVGEAPGANEDLTGIPFVGRAGRLLNEFLEKSGISREKDLYIINTVKCRPPQNRVPKDSEKNACRAYIEEQINIVNPKVIILCGSTALNSFYPVKTPISKIRGEWLKINIKGREYNSMPIFHPSYLLRNHSTEEGKPRWLMLKDLEKIKSV